MTPRIYLPAAVTDATFTLDATKSRHLLTVLRLTKEAEVIVFDGGGNAYPATLLNTDKNGVNLQTGDKLPPQAADLRIRTHIGQLVCAPAKMDWAVEKMTELGCLSITPLYGDKTRYRLTDKHLTRWSRLTIAAAEQCGRATLPQIHPPQPLDKWQTTLPAHGLRLLLLPTAATPLTAVLGNATNAAPTDMPIYAVCGGESGFSAAEETALQDSGFLAAHLGGRILRAETAALATLAIIESINKPSYDTK